MTRGWVDPQLFGFASEEAAMTETMLNVSGGPVFTMIRPSHVMNFCVNFTSSSSENDLQNT